MNNKIFKNLLKYNILIILLLLLFNFNKNIIIIFFTNIIIIFLFFKINTKNINDEKCDKNLLKNPYLNNLYFNDNDLDCKVDIKKQNKLMYYNTIYNKSDIFKKNDIKRQFYTMPNTNNVNNIIDISNLLYNNKYNCKYNNKRCLIYDYERYT
jgi:hypothetical protein